MCLVRSREASAGDLSVPAVQQNMALSKISHSKEPQELAKTRQREHESDNHVLANTSGFGSQAYREVILPNDAGDGITSDLTPVQCMSNTLTSTASKTTTKLKKVNGKSEKGKRSHRAIVVQHNYHDYSFENKGDRPRQQKSRGGVSIPFPLKLHEMLDKAMTEGHGDVVSWQPHGRCFVVYKIKDFQDIILPKYFKLCKLSSFQRQLNLYGFQRLTIGRDRGGYYHELFLRNKEFLAHDIKRVQVKGTGVRARSNPAQEPNFWTMQWCEPKVAVASTEDEIEVSNSMGGSVNNNRMTPMSYPRIYENKMQVETISIPNSIQPITTTMGPRLMSSMNAFYKYSMSESDVTSTRRGERPENGSMVLSFGDKAFHYLDPFQPISLEESRKDDNNENVISSLDAGRLEHFLK